MTELIGSPVLKASHAIVGTVLGLNLGYLEVTPGGVGVIVSRLLGHEGAHLPARASITARVIERCRADAASFEALLVAPRRLLPGDRDISAYLAMEAYARGSRSTAALPEDTGTDKGTAGAVNAVSLCPRGDSNTRPTV